MSALTVFRGHEGFVSSVAFSSDGRTLATGSSDNTARLWDVASGEEITVLHGHEKSSIASVSSVAFSPDGRTLATGARDVTARLWPLGQGVINLACARVQFLPLSEKDEQRFGIKEEWCMPEVSAKLRAELRLDEALSSTIDRYHALLKRRTRKRVPLQWAETQNNLGTALSRMGERESGTARLEEAVAAYRDAFTVFERAQASHYIEHTRANLERAQTLLQERQSEEGSSRAVQDRAR